MRKDLFAPNCSLSAVRCSLFFRELTVKQRIAESEQRIVGSRINRPFSCQTKFPYVELRLITTEVERLKGATKSFIVFLRLDNYIGFISEEVSAERLKKYPAENF